MVVVSKKLTFPAPATDGGTATGSALGSLGGLAADGAGNVYFFETTTINPYTNRIMRVSADGTMSRYARNGFPGFGGDGGPATEAWLNSAEGLYATAGGILYIADGSNNRIRRVDSDGIITTVAGNGTCCYKGDGGPALSASLA